MKLTKSRSDNTERATVETISTSLSRYGAATFCAEHLYLVGLAADSIASPRPTLLATQLPLLCSMRCTSLPFRRKPSRPHTQAIPTVSNTSVLQRTSLRILLDRKSLEIHATWPHEQQTNGIDATWWLLTRSAAEDG